MTPELGGITFNVPAIYTDQELDIIEEELKDVEDVTAVVCESVEEHGVPGFNNSGTTIYFAVETDNYNHIIGRLKLAVEDVLKRITPEYDR